MRSFTLPSVFALAVLALFAPVVSPAQTASVAPDASAAEKEEAPKIPGVEIARPGGGFLGLRTEGVTLRVTFYDKDKKKIPADAVRISARWRDGKPRLAVLVPSAPDTLSSPGVFQRPFNYLVFLTVIGPDDAVIESHSLMLAGTEKD